MKARGWFALIVAVVLCCASFADYNTPGWSKGFTSEGIPSTDLRLIGVDQSRSGLSGIFVYYNMSNESARTERVVITGVRNQAGNFWANATLQVKKTLSSEWETIAKSTGKGKPETITVAPNDASEVIQIDFDAFKRFITTHRMGRVIISTGATEDFTLNVLTPPEREEN